MSGLVAVLEEARDRGFLGPGPVAFHVEHAQAFLGALEAVPSGDAVDLGSGGGVPALVLALARPDLHWVLVEVMAKRAAFLEHAVTTLGLSNARVRHERAEEVTDLRGRQVVVTARSFGRPAVTAECAAPLLRVGGRLVVSEPPASSASDAGGRWDPAGLESLGLGPAMAVPGPPALVVAVQVALCPERYPRRSGVPAKRPLW
jgi:16S rRNA (guanine527-N7)-methyltransferase